MVALEAEGFECLVDANHFLDTPERMNFCPRRHCYVRYNEIHHAFRGTWANAEEPYLVHGGQVPDVGLATGAADTTLIDSNRAWLPGEHADHAVTIIGGRGFGQYRWVTGNTENTLLLARPWRVRPDHTSQYAVGAMYVENAWFANLNNTSSRMSLWLNCLANVVEYHRDVLSGGIDVWGTDRSRVLEDGTVGDADDLLLSWYNALDNGWMDGSSLHLWSGARAENLHAAPVLFANRVTRNRIRQPHMRRTGFARSQPVRDAGIVVGNRSGRDMTTPQDARTALSHTIIDGNFLSFTHNGISVSDYARKTFLLVFRDGPVDGLDVGAVHDLEGAGVAQLLARPRFVASRHHIVAAVPVPEGEGQFGADLPHGPGHENPSHVDLPVSLSPCAPVHVWPKSAEIGTEPEKRHHRLAGATERSQRGTATSIRSEAPGGRRRLRAESPRPGRGPGRTR